MSVLPGVRINGNEKNCIGSCLNIEIESIDSEKFLSLLSDMAISRGSACNAADPEPSHVLMAMGLTRDAANRSFRISVGRYTTEDDIAKASARIKETILHVRC